MAWYNPFSWFVKSEESGRGEPVLRCDNPQCGGVIDESDGIVEYDPRRGLLYHIGDCTTLGVARVLETETGASVVMSCIGFGEARSLFEQGKLAQNDSAR